MILKHPNYQLGGLLGGVMSGLGVIMQLGSPPANAAVAKLPPSALRSPPGVWLPRLRSLCLNTTTKGPQHVHQQQQPPSALPLRATDSPNEAISLVHQPRVRRRVGAPCASSRPTLRGVTSVRHATKLRGPNPWTMACESPALAPAGRTPIRTFISTSTASVESQASGGL
jgi:hypothetical protein